MLLIAGRLRSEAYQVEPALEHHLAQAGLAGLRAWSWTFYVSFRVARASRSPGALETVRGVGYRLGPLD